MKNKSIAAVNTTTLGRKCHIATAAAAAAVL